MKNALVLLCLLLFLSVATSGQEQPPVLKKDESAPKSSQPAPTPPLTEELGDDGTVRVSTALVTVPVSVMDRDGHYIADLKREEFRIYEDGVEQELAFFASTEKPFTVVLMLDVSDSAIFRLEQVKEEALLFLDQLRADDRAIVVAFDREVKVLAEATSNQELLRKAIMSVQLGKGTSLYNALDMTLKQVLSGTVGRKAIVLFTDGVDTSSMGATLESNLRDAAESDALIYAVQYPLAGSGQRYDVRPNNKGGVGWSEVGVVGRAQRINADRYLLTLPLKTGGRQFMTGSQATLRKAFADIAEELRHQYSLGYYPQAANGGSRRIKVRVTRSRLIVRARNSYGLGPDEGVEPPGQRK